MQSTGGVLVSRGESDRSSGGSESRSDIVSHDVGSRNAAEPNALDKSILSSAISSGMPTFMLTEGVPIIHRRAKKLVTAEELARAQRNNVPPGSVDYPPEKPVCLRGHTPATVRPSKVKVKPQRSVRGPRGVVDIQPGAFKKPGVLGGLNVSPWVVEEEREKAHRFIVHKAAISKNPVMFRRKREEGGLLDYAEEMHAVRRFLDEIHLIRDESCPPKCGFSYRRVCHDTAPPDFYDTRLDSVRPRTLGYSPGHIRALSPTPCLTWGGRESSRSNMDWGEGMGGSLGAVRSCFRGNCRAGSGPASGHHCTCPLPSKRSRFGQSWGTETFNSSNQAGEDERWSRTNQEPEAHRSGIEVLSMWSGRGLRQKMPTHASSLHRAPALRPFSSPCDQLGRHMSQEVLSRSTAGLKPQQFDTTQRRSAYTNALVEKRDARLSREAEEVVAAKLEKERRKSAAEGQEGIEKFEASLKEILAQKWKYL